MNEELVDKKREIMTGPLEDIERRIHQFGASLITMKMVLDALDESESARIAREDLIEEFGQEGIPVDLLSDSHETIQRADKILNSAAKSYEEFLGVSA